MLDGLYKKSIDRYWNRAALLLVRCGLQPNQVTWLGFGLAVVCSAAYLVHRSPLWFGISLALVFTLDALDGAVARVRDCATRYGGYLDATLDRYQEFVVLAAIGHVTGYWAVAFLVITGAHLTSYNKARVAVEIPIDNDAWPDLIERFERLFLLCTALILEPFVALPEPLPESFMLVLLLLLGILSHVTAWQRFLRAGRLLRVHD
jgi:phosphatidylglycerophosphate synthase